MKMETETERAVSFWEEVDVDDVFEKLLDLLKNLRKAIRTNTASDRDYVKAMKIVLESEVNILKIEHIEEVSIEDILAVTVSESQCSTVRLRNGVITEDLLHEDSSRHSKDVESSSDYSQTSSSGRNKAVCSHDPTAMMSPLSYCSDDQIYPVQLHDCGPSCLPRPPDNVLGENPLRIPMMYRFRRHRVPNNPDEEVYYKAPCGQNLNSMDEVLSFLLQSKSLGLLQPDCFTFDPRIDPERRVQRPDASSVVSDGDLSHGVEPVAVSLFNDVDDLRPEEFRYRKDRWPHGCFLSPDRFFSACCDCTDGCLDVQRCSCLQLSLGEETDKEEHPSYKHLRLNKPVQSGLYECGPWCSCDRGQCQNRLVQRGLRVRLQVFRTLDRGWAVRCQDDLDEGTFICIYAGVILRREQNIQASDLKKKESQMSDDEVQVVDEWTLNKEIKPSERSPPLHVPVIQRPSDQPARKQQKQVISSPDCSETENEDVLRKKPRLTESNGHRDGGETSDEDLHYISASTEGNVARFINHSCDANLFVQNVFVDTHDPKFPLIAFFTNRMIKAGTELTWNYSYKTGSHRDREVSCCCGYTNCQEFII